MVLYSIQLAAIQDFFFFLRRRSVKLAKEYCVLSVMGKVIGPALILKPYDPKKTNALVETASFHEDYGDVLQLQYV